MKMRAALLGIVLLTAMIFVFAGCSGNPKDESGQIIDVSVETVLMPAFEVYGWFYDAPLEHVPQPHPDYPAYYRVTDGRVSGMNGLSQAAHGMFSEKIAEKLLRNGTYIELDGVLYYVAGSVETAALDNGESSGAKAADEVIVREILSIISQDSHKVVYQTGVWYAESHDSAQNSTEVVYYDFVYEKLDEKWAFTEFEYYR